VGNFGEINNQDSRADSFPSFSQGRGRRDGDRAMYRNDVVAVSGAGMAFNPSRVVSHSPRF
jgi:hypothetical protein